MAARSSKNLVGTQLFAEIASLIEQARRRLATRANSELTLLYWRIGRAINGDVLQNKRADYGKHVVSGLATQLVDRYGRSFEARNLRRMMQFAEIFPDRQIVVPLARQLSWSHFVALIPLRSEAARLFYAKEAAANHLGKRELRDLIERKAYERMEIATLRNPQNSAIPPHLFKDPYLFDFMGLKDDYLESDLEAAILRDLERFILEFGKGFAFVERQKRMIIDGEDFSLDLLFYNRLLKRLVAVELKRGKFRAGDKGQMELYLNWLNRYERADGENEPIGLILCAEGNREQIELLELGKSSIAVAEYWTTLPPKAELEERIHLLLLEARERHARTHLISQTASSANGELQ